MQRKNIPNYLTAFRIALSPAISILICVNYLMPALILFCLVSITDFLDGYLSRKLNAHTKLGTCFDPVADKLLAMLSLLALIYNQSLIGAHIIPVILIFTREILISGIREFLSNNKHIGLPVSYFGKIKTAFQFLSISFLITNGKIYAPMHSIGIVLLWISAFMSALSLWLYIWNNFSAFLSTQK